MIEIFKNISVVVTLCVAVVGLWKLYHGRLRLVVKATQERYTPLPTAEQQIRQFADYLYKAIRTAELARLDDPEDSNPAIERFAKELQQKLPGDLFGDEYGIRAGRLLALKNVWSIEIRNVGKVEVKDLVLEFPYAGVYSTNEEETVTEFKDRINLGSIRSKGTVTLKIWTKNEHHGFSDNKIYLTHSAGAVPVSVGRVMFGKLPRVLGFFQEMGSLGVIFACLLGLWIFAGVWNYTHLKKAEQSQPATTQTTQSTTSQATP